jgi:hypothetical protein
MLAAAGGRATGLALPLPKSLNLTAAKATTMIQGMLKSGLIVERAATEGEAIWRTDDQLGKVTIVVTPEGLHAIGIEPGQGEDESGKDKPTRHRAMVKTATARAPKPAKAASPRAPKAPSTKTSLATPGSGTKLSLLVTALRLKKGATIKDLTDATGWQAHSVRGAISGALKKKQGLNVTSATIGGRGRVYRIAE